MKISGTRTTYPERGATIAFCVPARQQVTLQIFNVTGQLVKSLVNGQMEAGLHEVRWDGTSDNGETVKSGVYFYRISGDGFTDTKRMVLTR